VTSYHHASELSEHADAQFALVAQAALDDLLLRQPVRATAMGDHRFDGLLPDLSTAGQEEFADVIDDHITVLDALDDTELGLGAQLDFETVRSALARAAFEVREVARPHWDPLVWNPGDALWQLLSRETLETDDLARALIGRLRSIPEWLAVGRQTLGAVSRIHAETAVSQLQGCAQLLGTPIDRVIARDAELGRSLSRARDTAAEALAVHLAWVQGRVAADDRLDVDPRFGSNKYAAALWHMLDGGADVESLHSYASRALEDTQAALTEVAAMYLDEPETAPELVTRALNAAAESGAVRAETVLPIASDALRAVTEFAREHDLVTIPEDVVEVVAMPEIHRGVAVAYCDAPGVFERTQLPTRFCVAPPPDAWPSDRKASFYREYNAHMLHSLAVHEGVPGHALQLAHGRQSCGPTKWRQAFSNGAFVEGWAVYAEELVAAHEYPGVDVSNGDLAYTLTWLKMRLRSIINLLLDIGVHAHGMSEAEAMHLLVSVGHQEIGEATGKWRRALLTAGQLSTYFAGYLEVSAISADLQAMHPEFGLRQVHDTMLMFGSPSPRVLRQALGLPEVLVPGR